MRIEPQAVVVVGGLMIAVWLMWLYMTGNVISMDMKKLEEANEWERK